MKITDTTALNVLCRTSDVGTTESDFFGSGVYQIRDAIDRLTQKGYSIQTRKVTIPNGQPEVCWFISLRSVQAHAVKVKRQANGQTT